MLASLSDIATLTDARTKRISSYDTGGGNADHAAIKSGESLTLADIAGAGRITHIWITINCADPLARRNLILRAWWDGEENPSVESPIGDFFGQGWGEKYNWQSVALAAAPKEGNALVCYFPMPFSDGARITVENQSSHDVTSFYYYIDHESVDELPADTARFHAWWNTETTSPESAQGDVENEWAVMGAQPANAADTHNYLFADIVGRGHFVGVNYFVHCPSPIWYGEGDDMFVIDGESWPPSLHGTGTEDYFNMSWCPAEPYCHPLFGFGRVAGAQAAPETRFGWMGRTHCYRFHVSDPIRFTSSLRASIEHGHANTLTLEIASVAYWYQTEPHKAFPPLPDTDARKPRTEMSVVDVHLWRDAWRKANGGGRLWGNEARKS